MRPPPPFLWNFLAPHARTTPCFPRQEHQGASPDRGLRQSSSQSGSPKTSTWWPSSCRTAARPDTPPIWLRHLGPNLGPSSPISTPTLRRPEVIVPKPPARRALCPRRRCARASLALLRWAPSKWLSLFGGVTRQRACAIKTVSLTNASQGLWAAPPARERGMHGGLRALASARLPDFRRANHTDTRPADATVLWPFPVPAGRLP